jgi:hypothetical protein
MKTKATVDSSSNEMSLELKYCERCGGLWLRPVGGGQIYCVECGRSMAELPPRSNAGANSRMPQLPWGVNAGDAGGYCGEDGIDVETPGGAA